MEGKLCTKCARLLPRDAFRPRPERGPNALHSCCRECANVRARERYAAMSPEAREAVLSAARSRSAKRAADFDDAKREAERDRLRVYYLANRDELRARQAVRRTLMSDEQRDAEREMKRRWVAKNSERVKELRMRSAERNPAAAKQRSARWRERNRELAAARSKASREKKIGHYRRMVAEWAKRHPEKVRSKWAAYRSAQKGATPPWFDKVLVEEAYHLAQLRTKATGFQWHVDHIVPLQSTIVCGLHTIENLQVIPGALNISKGNRHWPQMPGER